ncbi:MAG: hypothetical protein CVU28_10525 [Betaproteobacteria bacterium HGW-Betaproteobacteria-21]|nr:MAG: hypothetical protein CVU28_10525 [Betaproteobacteria bacterium HGW-Betaproteobacteria-21]
MAHHYRWAVAIRLGREPLPVWPAAAEVQAVIGSSALIDGASQAGGVDVGSDLWPGQAVPALGATQFYFAEVPRAHRPELVLESLERLRVGAAAEI